MLFQLTPSKYEKESYQTIRTDSLFEEIESLLVPWTDSISEQEISNRLNTDCCILDKIKSCNSYVFPWTYKERKLVADNTDRLQFLILDIDNGLTIEEFKRNYTALSYYLYSSTGHGYKNGDRYRVIVPITQSITSEELVCRRNSIQEYFSVGGKCFLDKSTLDRSRGFVVPINTPFFTSFKNKTNQLLNLVDMKTSHSSGFSSKVAPGGYKGTVVTPEIQRLVNLYKAAKDGDSIPFQGAFHERNRAFYLINMAIAKYKLSEKLHIELAHEMNSDKSRNTVEQTVDDARRACREVGLSALAALSKASEVKAIPVKYLEPSNIAISKGKRHLLSATTGTGKTTLVLDKMRDTKIIFAAPLNAILTQNKVRNDGHSYTVLNGTESMPKTGESFLCSYDALLNLLRTEDLTDYLIVLDEFHRVLSDAFRIAKMSELVELLINKDSTVLAMSGTYDQSHFPVFNFHKTFAFSKANTEKRKINIIETSHTQLDALTALLMSFNEKDNVLVLSDKTMSHKATQRFLELEKPNLPFQSICSKDKSDIAELLKVGSVRGVLMTTQVLLEGVNLEGINKIIIMTESFPYAVEQMVQFYERDRLIELPNGKYKSRADCFLIRKPQDNSKIGWIPDAQKEKEYNNGVLEQVMDIGKEDLQNYFSVKDVDLIIRVDKQGYKMNLLQPYIVQKRAKDLVIFRTGLSESFDKYNYFTESFELKHSRSILLKKLQKEISEFTKSAIEAEIDLAFTGESSWSSYVDIFRAETALIDIEIKKVFLHKRLFAAYRARLTTDTTTFQENLNTLIKKGDVLSAEKAQKTIEAATLKEININLRINPRNYLIVLERYFDIKKRKIKGQNHVEILSVGLKGIDYA
jgi:hypothetical protein